MKNFYTKFLVLFFVFLNGYGHSYAFSDGVDDSCIVENLHLLSADEIDSLESNFQEFIAKPLHSSNKDEKFEVEIEGQEEDEEIESESESPSKKKTQIASFQTVVSSSLFQRDLHSSFSLISIYKNTSYVSLKRYILFRVIRI